MIIIQGFEIEDPDCSGKLRNIVRKLTIGEVYYFHFRREDSFFLTDGEVKKYRKEIPDYLKSNGEYVVKRKIDDERFDSIAYLKVTEDTYEKVFVLWKYFDGMTFFSPTNLLSWKEFGEIYDKIKPEEYGIGIIQKGYADSLFIKGDDGDNLIFVYNTDLFSKITDEVLKSIK